MKPTRYEGSGIWRDAAEQIEWYRRMKEMEASAKDAGISPDSVTREMAIKWRETGKWTKNAARAKGADKANANKARIARSSAPTCDLTGTTGVE